MKKKSFQCTVPLGSDSDLWGKSDFDNGLPPLVGFNCDLAKNKESH